MEVHAHNVPEQCTEIGFRKFLRPHLLRLSIHNVDCQKLRGKRFASLTFLNAADGTRFLSIHGQFRSGPNSRPTRFSISTPPLMWYNQPLRFERSNRAVNPLTLRVLKKEEKDRQENGTTAVNAHDITAKILPITFNCSGISCGVWSYSDSDLVFSPQFKLQTPGTAKFGDRAMIVTLNHSDMDVDMDGDRSLRIDFRYSSTLGITMESGTSASFIFSMKEAPRFSEKITDPVAALMAALGLSGTGQNLQRQNGPDRHRLPWLNEEHEPVAGICLVYRISLSPSSNQSEVGNRMHSLRMAPGLPPMIHRRTEILPQLEPYNIGFRNLQTRLASLNLDLPFILKFQIQKLVQNAYLSPNIVADLIPEIEKMSERCDISICVAVIRKLFNQIPFPGPEVESTELKLETLIDRLRNNENQCKRDGYLLEEAAAERSGNVAIVHKAKVMPSGIFLYGPEPETNNRVLRKYPSHHDYFLRVQFCDEDGQPVRFHPRISNSRIFEDRFKKTLLAGVTIAGRKFDFLGFSHSSLRAQSCWFVAPFIQDGSLIYGRLIIEELGKFSLIHSPAKCAARIGQAFSDTPITVKIDPTIVKTIKDVEFEGRIFSDGVGTMSRSVMYRVWDRLQKATLSKPSCFQIRYRGAKGMLSLDSRLEGDVLKLRDSMVKFDGTNKTDLEICESAYKPLPVYLNRQFIKILEDMGVHDCYFLDLQEKEINRLRMITDNPMNAASFLRRQSIGDVVHLPWLITELATLELDFREDDFLRNILQVAFLNELRQLKHKTRIPVEKGYHLHGIMDEYGILEEGQIFCIVRENGVSNVVVGNRLIISRAPALHPGDVQIVEGVNVPNDCPLLDLANCVVFSQKGSRDLPSQLSGGDLDGDRYYVIWDERCRPTKLAYPPADYPRQTPIDIGRSVTLEDMAGFFIQFMETDQLGRIAVLHRVLSDQREQGTLDQDCITLAGMHSTAVDFSKTGIPVDMSLLPKYNRWRPDFEAPGPHVTIEKREGICFDLPANRAPDGLDDDEDDDFTNYRYYESEKILGKLYRAIDERKIFEEIRQRSTIPSSTKNSTLMQTVWKFVQRQCRLIQYEHHLQWARDIRDEYEECLLNIMTEYSDHPLRPLSELEAFVGNILGRTGAQSKSQRELSTSLKEKFALDAHFFVNCIVKDGDEYSPESLERSIACLSVSLEDKTTYKRGEKLLSFKYVAAAVCLREVDRMGNISLTASTF